MSTRCEHHNRGDKSLLAFLSRAAPNVLICSTKLLAFLHNPMSINFSMFVGAFFMFSPTSRNKYCSSTCRSLSMQTASFNVSDWETVAYTHFFLQQFMDKMSISEILLNFYNLLQDGSVANCFLAISANSYNEHCIHILE